VLRLDNPMQRYAWGSATAVPELLGRAPDGDPVAELWLGAHPALPSLAQDLAGPRRLDELVAADPVAALGSGVVARFGPALPYLLKVIAADRPLSLQVHPEIERARAGFAAEEAAGVPVDAPHRNYRDTNHKPDLDPALTAQRRG